ncbi:MAG TPA: hypothetical protein DDW29_17405 [Gammaproteobacteria bacterium]|nr:hypothetical protein [Gammaproteobacteria bacterium]|tara:strand:- start:774 stop:1562 length:789 start_codon:yes stop_codon:yes gene_type:complete
MWMMLTSINIILMVLAWFVCTSNKRAGLVDVTWALGLGLNTIIAAISLDQSPIQLRLFLGIASSIWFIRLGVHLLRRYINEEEEDSRYATMRKAMGKFQHIGFLLFFLFQAGLILLFVAPIVLLLSEPANAWDSSLNTLIGISFGIFVLAFAGESLADHQLYEFKKNRENKGKTMDQGLWKYSRHPNYFFEWTHWIIYPLLGLAAGLYSLWIYPVLMFVFLYYFTGIPFSEKQALLSKGDNYKRYQEKTPAFFPWKPKDIET